MYGCSPVCRNIRVGDAGASHEFDIYAENIVIGGVSTGTLKTSGQNRNTGSCDRACSELLWLSLWPGCESRVDVLTDRAIADWLVVRHFKGVAFPCSITIYHYNCADDTLHQIGILGGGSDRMASTQL
jgi:hypothetical protein